MFKQSLILATLVAVPCLGAYNPKDIFFELLIMHGEGQLPEFPQVSASLTAVMRNVPLYFVSTNGTRDYVKSVSFMVAKDVNGTYDLRYKVISSYKCEDMVLKDVNKETIESALKDTFPDLQDPFFVNFLIAFPTPSGKTGGGNIKFTVESLYELRESESNKERFVNSMTFVNHFLPIEKLHFDENDLLVPEVKATTTKGSWFSFNAWRDWLFSK